MPRWRNSHKNPPKVGQKVYYYGPNIGLWVGRYKYEERVIKSKKGHPDVQLCPHVFYGDDGMVDACDAPYWHPWNLYDARPNPPKIMSKKIKSSTVSYNDFEQSFLKWADNLIKKEAKENKTKYPSNDRMTYDFHRFMIEDHVVRNQIMEDFIKKAFEKDKKSINSLPKHVKNKVVMMLSFNSRIHTK